MINYYKKVVFENYANFKGRASRSEYWYFTLMNLIVAIILGVIDSAIGKNIFGGLYGLAVFLPGIAVAVRRLHDVGKSGWFLLASYLLMGISFGVLMVGLMSTFIPSFPVHLNASDNILVFALSGVIFLTAMIYIMVLFCKKSDEGTNKYGSNPFEEENELDLLGAE